jgi:hypothetical protein
VRVGAGCARLHDAMMRELHCDVLELDEVWSFVGKKEGHLREGDPPEFGDAYTFIALDATAKIIPRTSSGSDRRRPRGFWGMNLGV